jgi:hypothetical protein
MTPLHWIGDQLRAWLLGVPMPLVRALFVALPLVLIVWVLRRPAGADPYTRRMKRWAVAALLIQAALYLLL